MNASRKPTQIGWDIKQQPMNPTVPIETKILKEQDKRVGIIGNPIPVQRWRKIGAVSGVDAWQILSIKESRATEHKLLNRPAGIAPIKRNHQDQQSHKPT